MVVACSHLVRCLLKYVSWEEMNKQSDTLHSSPDLVSANNDHLTFATVRLSELDVVRTSFGVISGINLLSNFIVL